MEATKVQELLGISLFKHGVAEPVCQTTSDQEAVKILQANELVKSCEILAERHIHVELVRALDMRELYALKRALLEKCILFRERRPQLPLHAQTW